jgi:mRNA-degrading endonuclease RelE of RelBE toxin-antitoxin system
MIILDQAKAIDNAITLIGAENNRDFGVKMKINRANVYRMRKGDLGIGASFYYKLACITDLPMSEIKRRLTDGI